MRRSIKMLGRIFGEAFGQPGRAVARRSRQDRARSGRSTRHWLEALEPRLLLARSVCPPAAGWMPDLSEHLHQRVRGRGRD